MQKELLQETIDIAKVAIKSEKITPYGGLSHEMDIFSKRRFEKLIESTLGSTWKYVQGFQIWRYVEIRLLLFFCRRLPGRHQYFSSLVFHGIKAV
jgi:hypothetical protein